MKHIFDNVSARCSKFTTKQYSSSFSLGIRFLAADLRPHIYNVYGFVRFADEIVDTFHEFDKELLLREFREDTYKAIERGISLNPILNSFQHTVRTFNIDHNLIETFLKSMEMDLSKDQYSQAELDKYILGSAEVVGLMCLTVFTRGDLVEYEKLKASAMQLGAAFQKINFLRDLNADFNQLGRTYFPGIDLRNFDENSKKLIEDDIANNFKLGFEGIKQLPKDSRFGVYLAYKYFYKLFLKIKRTQSQQVLNNRIRIPGQIKYKIFLTSLLRHKMNVI